MGAGIPFTDPPGSVPVPMHPQRLRRRFRRLRLTAGSACALAAALAGCGRAAGAATAGEMRAELAALGAARTEAPRLSIPTVWRPCTARVPAGGTVARSTCAATAAEALPSDRVLDLAARAAERVHAGVDADALHASALVDLLWGGEGGISLERSLQSLQAAARLADRPAPALADLSAAYLVRAGRTQSPRDLLEAMEAAERALEAEPALPAARFNLALAAELLGLQDEAGRAWRAYLRVDSTSAWAREARGRMRALASTPAPPPEPPRGAPRAALEAYAAAAPQEALLLGWDHALGEWGEAVQAGDAAAAAASLGRAEALGLALERRGGDATLADAVRAIRARAADPAATRALAAAHRAYAAGRAAYQAADFEAADSAFRAARAGAAASPALGAWADLFHAATRVYAGRLDEADTLFAALAAREDAARHPALVGRCRWSRGTALLRAGRYERARAEFRAAEALLRRAGEREQLGAVQYLVGEAELALGDAPAGYAALHRALATLRPYRGSPWLHNVLGITAQAATGERLFRAALRVEDEDVAAAGRTGLPLYAAEARLARARLHAAAGHAALAAQDVEAGRAIVAAMEPGMPRRWFTAQVRLSEAALAAGRDPARAAAALDSVVGFFTAAGTPLLLLPALVRRAEARLAAGEPAAAGADLDQAAALLARMGTDVTGAALRASLLDAARGVFDRMALLQAAAGRPAQALAELERGRASLEGGAPPRTEPPRAPPGEVAVAYALVGDTLLAWTVSGARVELARSTVPRAALAREIERARSALELRAGDPAARAALAALHGWLVRPVERRLGPPGTPLVVVADGEIAGVPFAALLDARGRYLVEDHPLRFAATLRDAGRRPAPGPPRGTALLVADPAFDPAAHPGLGRLPGAAAEVGEIAALYPGARVLAGPAASRAALERELPRAAVVHYAGHALFDDARAERSALVLAGGGAEGALTAERIAHLQLGGVRLVALSACSTLRARDGRSGGFAGLSGALLAAGAGGVVGSLWRVDDQLTRTLMVEFHRAYRQTGDGPGALRQAQLRLLRSADPALRTPAAWAGFRYAGS